jgi:hypothetical protein
MKYPKCQIDNVKENSFCCKCYTRLVASCPKCGADVLQDDRCCGTCDHFLKEAEEPPLIDYQQPQSYTPKLLAKKMFTTRSSIEEEGKVVTVTFVDSDDLPQFHILSFLFSSNRKTPVLS